jgi:hypothetical protein
MAGQSGQQVPPDAKEIHSARQMSAPAGGYPHTGVMRQAFAHEAVLVMEPDADVRAPGAAVAVALCGHWDHEPPCPLSPHHVSADEDGEELRVRILFAAEPDAEGEARHLIDQALSGQIKFPDGFTTPVAATHKLARRGLSRRDRPCRAPDAQLSNYLAVAEDGARTRCRARRR